MSIPKIRLWDPTGVFPAGANPWNSQPSQIAPITLQFVPGTPADSPAFNWLMNAITAGSQGAIDGLCYGALNEFSPPVTDPAGTGFTLVEDVKWSSVGQNWVSASDDSGTTKLATSQDGGATWQLIGSGFISKTGGTALALSVAPDGTIAVASSVTATGHVTKVVGTTYTGTVVASLNNITFATGVYFSGLHHFFSGVQSGGSFTSTWVTSPDAVTWTARTMPAGYGSGTDHIGQVMTAFDSSHTNLGLLVGFCGVTAGSDTAKLMLVANATPTAAVDVTPSSGALLARIITGLAYAPGVGTGQGTFGLLAYDGTDSTLWTCQDPSVPAHWTLTKTFSGLRLDSLQSLGQIWTSSLVQNGLRRIIMSQEPTGSLDWAYGCGLSGSWTESGLPVLVSGGGQSVAIMNSANIAVSAQAGCLQGAIV